VVSDDGVGIPPDHMDRIFDPFFTTRLGQGGSGLGLNIVYNIVTGMLGGRVRVDSKPGEGAAFIVPLPLAAPRIAAAFAPMIALAVRPPPIALKSAENAPAAPVEVPWIISRYRSVGAPVSSYSCGGQSTRPSAVLTPSRIS